MLSKVLNVLNVLWKMKFITAKGVIRSVILRTERTFVSLQGPVCDMTTLKNAQKHIKIQKQGLNIKVIAEKNLTQFNRCLTGK